MELPPTTNTPTITSKHKTNLYTLAPPRRMSSKTSNVSKHAAHASYKPDTTDWCKLDLKSIISADPLCTLYRALFFSQKTTDRPSEEGKPSQKDKIQIWIKPCMLHTNTNVSRCVHCPHSQRRHMSCQRQCAHRAVQGRPRLACPGSSATPCALRFTIHTSMKSKFETSRPPATSPSGGLFSFVKHRLVLLRRSKGVHADKHPRRQAERGGGYRRFTHTTLLTTHAWSTIVDPSIISTPIFFISTDYCMYVCTSID